MEKLKGLIISVLQEEQTNHMNKQKRIKELVLAIVLTILPIFIFIIMPALEDKYFDLFSGRLMYLSQDYYFSFSPLFIFDLPYFFTPIISALAVWFCLKIRKSIENRSSFFNYLNLVLIVLNSVFSLYSLWFLLLFYK
ncbi:TPA: hypothetical protein DEP30_02285 [Candidatus Nomurabacteria bacterium]|nr:MAG: hypothetical protein UR97_C0003G0035 [Candidatus Nomurabacteria bacterium GW2011_GWE2_36_115]KKP94097.1 MAG: hypothetical protein US00_C0003G0021 [Candidatus Nomurabacteria bacterium GW2011_GWF2_36_126]KKP96775.1 MAG: hypothetical protein US04_C0001G0277 [Candidatus Nomurabacteria bacterium GW2011_GWD2_36_14]KKP99621.1 MAG: hypothetical protein US08_C0001G0304 [Candidatus Nomurabacteria bacterium GW2011_GWF2_36_19]KKQ05463.1 MAG: hypothetical protein US17_C0004G0035 [Candidatus Nomuraba